MRNAQGLVVLFHILIIGLSKLLLVLIERFFLIVIFATPIKYKSNHKSNDDY